MRDAAVNGRQVKIESVYTSTWKSWEIYDIFWLVMLRLWPFWDHTLSVWDRDFPVERQASYAMMTPFDRATKKAADQQAEAQSEIHEDVKRNWR